MKKTLRVYQESVGEIRKIEREKRLWNLLLLLSQIVPKSIKTQTTPLLFRIHSVPMHFICAVVLVCDKFEDWLFLQLV